jgi:hypothetical protein
MKTAACILDADRINTETDPKKFMDAFRQFVLSLALLLLGFAGQVRAAAPANDNFASSILLSGTNIVVEGTLLGATLQSGEPPHDGDGASVWYRWVAPRTGRVRLACEQRIMAYTGSQLSTLVAISRDTGPDFPFVKVFDAVAGTTYRICVSGSPANQSPFTLRLHYTPLNDDFAASILLSGLPIRVEGSTIGATLETGESRPTPDAGKSVWWTYTPPGTGMIEFTEADTGNLPPLWVYDGVTISNLTLMARSHVRGTDRHLKCMFSCDVSGGRTYYIGATTIFIGNDEIETNFAFNMVFKPAPPNDAFASRLTIEPSATIAFSTTVGASREPGEPWRGSNSVWWSWTPTQPGPVILTTYGSACDTMLGVYVGNSLGSVIQVATNDDCFVWSTTSPAAGFTTTNGPTNDVISRVRINADNGVQYKIAVSVAPHTLTNPPGGVTMNLTKLAIDDIVGGSRSTNADRSLQFTSVVRLINLRSTASLPLRLRLFARAGYSYNQSRYYNCPWENFTFPDIALGTVSLPAPGTIAAAGVTQVTVSGVCPPPNDSPIVWGYGYGVIAVLEERQATGWVFQDARMIVIGEWPRISGSSGPGGGVILVSASLQGGNEVGFLDVRVGPPAAVRLGGAWRVSPTNYGEFGELRPYTNYTSSNLRLAVRSTNFSMDTRPLNGFFSPSNRSVNIQPAAIVPLDLMYSVHPPLLTFDRVRGLGVLGTPQTTHRIQHVTNLPAVAWPSYTNITLGIGTNWIPQTTNTFSNRFYRALWLSQ